MQRNVGIREKEEVITNLSPLTYHFSLIPKSFVFLLLNPNISSTPAPLFRRLQSYTQRSGSPGPRDGPERNQSSSAARAPVQPLVRRRRYRKRYITCASTRPSV